VEGDVVAEELTIGGQVKGTIHANRVKLNSTAVVEGEIFHRSLSIEENARFEGSSKREDDAVDVPRTPLRRPAAQDDLQTKVTAIEGNRKSNAAPALDGHPNAGAQMLSESPRAQDPAQHLRGGARRCPRTDQDRGVRAITKPVEMLFAHLKRILRLGRLRLRGPCGAQFEFMLAAITQNLRRLAKLVLRPPPAAETCLA